MKDESNSLHIPILDISKLKWTETEHFWSQGHIFLLRTWKRKNDFAFIIKKNIAKIGATPSMAILIDVEVDKWTEHAAWCTACGKDGTAKVRNSKEEKVVGLNGLEKEWSRRTI